MAVMRDVGGPTNSNVVERNEKLRAASDLLLPRLKSGEIAV